MQDPKPPTGATENPSTIPAICAAWLKANGFDGLCDPDIECGCSVPDLMPCEMPHLRLCVPAHKVAHPDGGWMMFPGKTEEAQP